LSKLPLNWERVSNKLKELSDSSRLEAIIAEKIEIVVKEKHPNDYDGFIEQNKEKLDALREELKGKYSLNLKEQSNYLSAL
jgi:hypothetical protein